MKPVQNTIPSYMITHPIGTKLRWINPKSTPLEIITVAGYSRCVGNGCEDCDRLQYLAGNEWKRCHYRSPESQFGLCYWEKVDEG